jgi:ABC-2 type transport system ATP-binding protein
MGEAVIETHQLSKRFGSLLKREPHLAVNNINLYIEPGQVYGFLGPNGAGKSTTIRMLLNLMRPTAGHVTIFGQNPRQNPSILRRVGALVEGATFYSYLKAWDNLKVIGHSQGGFDEARARQLLEFVGLADKSKTRVGKFSTGMTQRLGIAAALLQDPELVILDEPTNGMDPMGVREMRRFIRDLAHTHQKTVLLTSHLLAEVQHTCDRVAIIHQGVMVAEGKIEDLLKRETLVEAEVSSVEQAQVVLSQWPLEIGPTPGHIRIHATREQTPQIVRQLVEGNIEVFRISQTQQSLEDYFMTVIGADGYEGRLQ